jgi:septum site-determining protein MinC
MRLQDEMTEEKHSNSLQIKGIKEGLLITLGEGEWGALEESVIKSIEAKQSFFQGARIALNVGSHDLRAAELGALRDKLSERGVSLWAVLSSSKITRDTSKTYGLITSIVNPKVELESEAAARFDTSLPGESAVMVHRTMRSGFKITHTGHVVVIGDVNPGAEIVASGSVVVWGRLRGVVHAGAEGDEKAVVCALRLEPTQLRIASYIAVTPKHKGRAMPEMASIKNGQVIAEHWNDKEGGR